MEFQPSRHLRPITTSSSGLHILPLILRSTSIFLHINPQFLPNLIILMSISYMWYCSIVTEFVIIYKVSFTMEGTSFLLWNHPVMCMMHGEGICVMRIDNWI